VWVCVCVCVFGSVFAHVNECVLGVWWGHGHVRSYTHTLSNTETWNSPAHACGGLTKLVYE
jgi:hypothetical protein